VNAAAPRALVAFTRPAARRLGRLWAAWPDADFYVADKWAGEVGPAPGPGRLVAWNRSARELVSRLADRYRVVVMGLSLGAVVRLWAPYLVDKWHDPAVLAVDDGGRWVLSVLGGHAARANELAIEAAGVLGAQPVVTTATDSLGLPDLEAWVAEAGLVAEDPHAFRAVSAALVNGRPVGWVTDCELGGRGAQDTLAVYELVRPYPSLAVARAEPDPPAAWIVVSHRRDAEPGNAPALVLRPRCLALGVGTVRGAPPEGVAQWVRTTLEAAGLAAKAVGVVASVHLKAGEAAIGRLAEAYGAPVRLYSPDALRSVAVPSPSAAVDAFVGTPSVSEAAAILAAGGGSLLLPKRRSRMATVAVAHLRDRPKSDEE
jgi:cobalamin biosynthesis protein CbiG